MKRSLILIAALAVVGCGKMPAWQTQADIDKQAQQADLIQAMLERIVNPQLFSCTGNPDTDKRAFRQAIIDSMKNPYHFVEYDRDSAPCGVYDDEPAIDFSDLPGNDITIYGGVWEDVGKKRPRPAISWR